MADESVGAILKKKDRGEKLSRSEAGKLGAAAYKAKKGQKTPEANTLDDVLAKKARGEKLTQHERGILGGKSRKEKLERGGEEGEFVVGDDVVE